MPRKAGNMLREYSRISLEKQKPGLAFGKVGRIFLWWASLPAPPYTTMRCMYGHVTYGNVWQRMAWPHMVMSRMVTYGHSISSGKILFFCNSLELLAIYNGLLIPAGKSVLTLLGSVNQIHDLGTPDLWVYNYTMAKLAFNPFGLPIRPKTFFLSPAIWPYMTICLSACVHSAARS